MIVEKISNLYDTILLSNNVPENTQDDQEKGKEREHVCVENTVYDQDKEKERENLCDNRRLLVDNLEEDMEIGDERINDTGVWNLDDTDVIGG